jgi:hypothetical protein
MHPINKVPKDRSLIDRQKRLCIDYLSFINIRSGHLVWYSNEHWLGLLWTWWGRVCTPFCQDCECCGGQGGRLGRGDTAPETRDRYVKTRPLREKSCNEVSHLILHLAATKSTPTRLRRRRVLMRRGWWVSAWSTPTWRASRLKCGLGRMRGYCCHIMGLLNGMHASLGETEEEAQRYGSKLAMKDKLWIL